MGDRKFTQALHRRGDAAKIRSTVAQQMKETSLQVGFRPTQPICLCCGLCLFREISPNSQ